MVHAVEKALDPGPYILGSRFSAVDVYIGSQLGFGMMRKCLEPLPAFQSYVGLISQRPAYKRVNEQSEQLAARVKSQSTIA